MTKPGSTRAPAERLPSPGRARRLGTLKQFPCSANDGRCANDFRSPLLISQGRLHPDGKTGKTFLFRAESLDAYATRSSTTVQEISDHGNRFEQGESFAAPPRPVESRITAVAEALETAFAQVFGGGVGDGPIVGLEPGKIVKQPCGADVNRGKARGGHCPRDRRIFNPGNDAIPAPVPQPAWRRCGSRRCSYKTLYQSFHQQK